MNNVRLGVIAKFPVISSFVAYRRRVALSHALRLIRRLSPGEAPSRELVGELHAAWGNPEFIASVSYLEAAASRAVALKGSVLECGSGLSTLLLGTLADRNGFTVWTLEHEREWYEAVKEILERNNIRNVRLVHAPLRDLGDGISWYDVRSIALPDEFSLVVCDGPPNWTTPGGRYGLVAAMREHFSRDWNILLDDPIAAEKTGMLPRLESEPGVRAVKHVATDGAYFWITRNANAT